MKFCARLTAGALLCASGVFASRGSAQQVVTHEDRRQEDEHAAQAVLNRKITITLPGVSLDQAIRRIAARASVTIWYTSGIIAPYEHLVTLQATGQSIRQVLEQLFAGTPLQIVVRRNAQLYVVDGRIAEASTEARDSTGTISGVVADSATGKPLSRVTVKVIGTSRSALTRDDGRFSIDEVPVGTRQVSVRMFGYRPVLREVTISDVTTMHVSLTAVTTLLSGVVTTATGAQDRRSIGNDVTVINADSVLRIAPVHSVTDLLETRVAGLTVQRTSGVPGAPARIRLRGIGGGLDPTATNASNDPIVIVDGIRVYARASTPRDRNMATLAALDVNTATYSTPSALDQIDPNSIEKIEVFKGASATSQWGSDAGNGVIVITTKHGRSGPAQVSLSLNAGINSIPGAYSSPNFFVFGHSYSDPTSHLCLNANFSDPMGFHIIPELVECLQVDSVVPFQALNMKRLTPFGRGTDRGGSATLSGGSSALTYSITGTANRTVGYLVFPSFYRDVYMIGYGVHPPSWMIHPDQYSVWGATGVFGIAPVVGLRMTITTSLNTSDQQQSSGQTQLPLLSGIYVDTANILSYPLYAQRGVDQYVQRVRSRKVTANTAVQGDWTRWARLPVQMNAGVNTVNQSDRADVARGVLGPQIDSVGHFNVGRGLATTRTGTASATLFPGQRVSAAMGIQAIQASTEDFRAFKDTLAPGVTEPAFFSQGAQSTYASTTAGWFVEPRLNLNSRFSRRQGSV